jgi:hypothetical protein
MVGTVEERIERIEQGQQRIERLLTRGQRETRRDLGLLAIQAQLTDLGVTAMLCAGCVGIVGAVFVGAQMRESAKENMPAWAYNILWGWAGDSAPFSNGDAAKVVSAAVAWVGKDFKPGESARCADWVREVLKAAGVNIGVAKGSAGPLMADSFHGAELGEIILDASQLQPGDIVMFADTYDGPGRSPIPGRGRITHVGIYVGNGEMVDRSTRSAPVKQRPISTFKFHSALRPSAYKSAAAGGGDFVDRYIKRVANKESGGNYGAVNTSHPDPNKQALGKYQFMPETLVSTAEKCLGRAPSRSEFLGSPKMQEKIMRCYISYALPTVQQQSSDPYTQCRMMAAFHYSGSIHKYNDTSPQSWGGDSYPSIAAYTKSVCKGF